MAGADHANEMKDIGDKKWRRVEVNKKKRKKKDFHCKFQGFLTPLISTYKMLPVCSTKVM